MPQLLNFAEHNCHFLRQKGRFRFYSASNATVLIRWQGEWRQMCLLGFGSDGSVRVQWPYLAVEQGIVAEAEIPPGAGRSTRVHLRERGKFTSQLVKFSHHVSGVAHFSLTGRVKTDVRRRSFPLNGPIGRLFELTVYFPAGFKRLDHPKRNRVYLQFTADDRLAPCLQIRGEWRRKADIVEHTIPSRATVGPQTTWRHRSSGEESPVYFMGPLLECPISTHVLCVTCCPAPVPNGARRPGLVFMGGFDHHETTGASKPMELRRFLSAMFPTASSESVRRTIGSIDLEPEKLS